MSVLSDELANDPETIGYAAISDIDAAASLNTVNRSVNRTSMTGSELLANTDSVEYNGLTDAKRDQWLSLCGVDSIDPFGSVVQIVVQIWGGGSTTISNLQAARIETVSRAEELGLGFIEVSAVTFARTGAY